MKLKVQLRSGIAGLMAFAMVVTTLLPNSISSVQAAENDGSAESGSVLGLNIDSDKVQDMQTAADGFVVPPLLRSGDILPVAPEGMTVTFENAQGLRVTDGAVYSDSEQSVAGSVDAVITVNGESVKKTFQLTVLPSSAKQLLGYHRSATNANEGNDGSSAYSMHLALKGRQDNQWEPLNKNYGIMFVKYYSSRKDESRGLINPQIFVMKDGYYGIVATRTTFAYNQATNTPDSTGTSSMFFAMTKDFQNFIQTKNDNTIDVGETEGVNYPYAVYDSANDQYVVGWIDNNKVAKYTTFADLKDAQSAHDDVRIGEVSRCGKVGTADSIDNYVAGYSVPISDDLALSLEQRFGRVYNTDYQQFEEVTVEKDSNELQDKLPRNATLNYSDGSTGRLPVQWDTSSVDTSKSGKYTITGQVQQTNYNPKVTGKNYTVPFAEDRADPDLFKFDWTHKVDGETVTEEKYLFIATNDTDGECRMPGEPPYAYMGIRMGDTIEEMSDVAGDPEKTIDQTGINEQEHVLCEAGDMIQWGDSGERQEMTGSFWAPELHRIGGKLSILFAPGIAEGGGEQRSAIMQLKKDADGYDLDPTQRENWEEPRIITYADGRTWTGSYCDMTYFEDKDGQSYYLSAGFVIAKFDPETPWKLSAASSKDTKNYAVLPDKDFAWEAGGAYEGQYVLEHDGRYYITYSARRVDGRYTLGYQSAAVDSNLMDPASWTKSETPVLFSSIVDGEWQSGPGHAAFAEGPNGETLFVYHTYSHVTRGDGFRGGERGDGTGDAVKKTNGRDAYIRRVHWGTDNRMILDMTQSEELAEANKTLSITVNVQESQQALKEKIEEAKKEIEIPNAENVRGNITLLSETSNGTKVSWESSDENVVSTKTVKNEDYDDTPAGVVTRDKNEDKKVILTATLTQGNLAEKRIFELTVKKAPDKPESQDYKGYLFVSFTGEDTANGEQIYFSTSKDGLHWEDLNNMNPVLTSTLGEKGVRDPFIMRSAEGDRFYLIATDLKINGKGKGAWSDANYRGSKSIMIWESDDLVHWSDQRMVKVSVDHAGCTWAPEFIYDEKTGEYFVYWASMVQNEGEDKALQKVYYAKTRDFYTFTEPKLYISKSDHILDTTIIKEGEWYYRISNDDTAKRIKMDRGKNLLGDLSEFEPVNTPALDTLKKVEGPAAFKLNGTDQWCLMVDRSGADLGYLPLITDDISTGAFRILDDSEFYMGAKKRHGAVINLTQEEYDAVMKKWGGEAEEPILESIGVTAPTQTVYTTGEALNLAGMKVTAYYSDGSEKDINIKDCTVAGYDKDQTGKQTVTVTYEDKSAAFDVTVKEKELPYVDVDKKDWYYSAVYYNYFAETMTGLDGIHFGPGEFLARAQFAMILYRMNDMPKVEYKPTFPDVPDEMWFTDAVLWAADTGVIECGESNKFGPSDNINREQMAVMMYRYANYKKYESDRPADLSGYTDASKVSTFAKEAMEWAVGNNIISGKGNGTLLDPQGNATRAECATIIMRFMEKFEK